MTEYVPIGELKAKLSEYVRRARAGAPMIVTDRGVPVARLGPLGGDSAERGHLEELERAGLVRRPRAKLSKDFLGTERPADPASRSLEAILEERAESP